jgi:hypothetical protein
MTYSLIHNSIKVTINRATINRATTHKTKSSNHLLVKPSRLTRNGPASKKIAGNLGKGNAIYISHKESKKKIYMKKGY